MEKTCNRCGETFECREDSIVNCHCATIELDELMTDYIRNCYYNCLCKNCLEAVKNNFYAIDINPQYAKRIQ